MGEAAPGAERMERRRVAQLWGQLVLLGLSGAVVIHVTQESVTGAVNQSVLLPVSYRMNRSASLPLVIQWSSQHRNPFITYNLNKVFLREDGLPISCNGSYYVHETYRNRTVFFPENASLCLMNLQMSDSGVYTIGFRDLKHVRNITLTVRAPDSRSHPPPINGTTADGVEQQESGLVLLVGSAVGGCAAGLTLVLLLYCVLRPRQRKTIQQQQGVNSDDQLQLQDQFHQEDLHHQEGQIQLQDDLHQLYASVSHGEPAKAVYSMLGKGSRRVFYVPETSYTELSFSKDEKRAAFSTSTF